MPELSASIMYLAESQVALISQQARWQSCVGSVRVDEGLWEEGQQPRGGRIAHTLALSSVPVQLCFSLQLELLICSICGRGHRVKQNTCLVAEARQAGTVHTSILFIFLFFWQVDFLYSGYLGWIAPTGMSLRKNVFFSFYLIQQIYNKPLKLNPGLLKQLMDLKLNGTFAAIVSRILTFVCNSTSHVMVNQNVCFFCFAFWPSFSLIGSVYKVWEGGRERGRICNNMVHIIAR